jgi:hypothetical protein
MIDAALVALDDFEKGESEFKSAQSEAGSKLLQAANDQNVDTRKDLEKQAELLPVSKTPS